MANQLDGWFCCVIDQTKESHCVVSPMISSLKENEGHNFLLDDSIIPNHIVDWSGKYIVDQTNECNCGAAGRIIPSLKMYTHGEKNQ